MHCLPCESRLFKYLTKRTHTHTCVTPAASYRMFMQINYLIKMNNILCFLWYKPPVFTLTGGIWGRLFKMTVISNCSLIQKWPLFIHIKPILLFRLLNKRLFSKKLAKSSLLLIIKSSNLFICYFSANQLIQTGLLSILLLHLLVCQTGNKKPRSICQ